MTDYDKHTDKTGDWPITAKATIANWRVAQIHAHLGRILGNNGGVE